MLEMPFTDEAGRVLVSAGAEATRLRHDSIRTEHILAGLLLDREGSAAIVLRNLGKTVSELENIVRGLAPRGESEIALDAMFFDLEAQQALVLARAAAQGLGKRVVDTTHLLLGLIREEKGIAAAILHQCGFNDEEVRAEIQRLSR